MPPAGRVRAMMNLGGAAAVSRKRAPLFEPDPVIEAYKEDIAIAP